MTAPAKLTLSLRITGVRADGYHLLDTEMVAVDLADTLVLTDADEVQIVVDVSEWPGARDGTNPRTLDGRTIPAGSNNLVARALAAVGRHAQVRLVKRIPPGAGLGGGSSDAAAILRFAGRRDAATATSLGADVPFCVQGGRARVRGIGEVVDQLPHEDRSYVLLLLPFGVDTAAVYRAWDGMHGWPSGDSRRGAEGGSAGGNDLEPAALLVEPRLARWREAFEELTGRDARLAGSGSTWFVEGSVESLGPERSGLEVGGESGVLVTARTVGPHF